MCQNCLCYKYIVYDQIGSEWYTQYCFMRNAFINTVFKFSVDLRKKRVHKASVQKKIIAFLVKPY